MLLLVIVGFLVGGINKFGHRPATGICRLNFVGRLLGPALPGEGPLVVAHELTGPLPVGGEAEGGAALAALLHPSRKPLWPKKAGLSLLVLEGCARGDVPPLDEVLRVLVLQVHAEPGDFYPPLSSSEAFLLECFCEWGWSKVLVEFVCECVWEVVIRVKGGVAGGAEVLRCWSEDVLCWGTVKCGWGRCDGSVCGGGWLGRWVRRRRCRWRGRPCRALQERC